MSGDSAGDAVGVRHPSADVGARDAADAPRAFDREARLTLAAGLAATLAFGLQWAGLQPVVVVAIALVTWFLVLARRLGPTFAAGIVPVGWVSLVFAAVTISPAIAMDARVASNAALVAATLAATAVVRAAPATTPLRPHVPVLLASLAGGAAWIVGLAWGLIATTGGGLSWAMYRDATMDVWSVRSIVEYRGIGSGVNTFLFQPLNPAVSTSFVSPTVSVDVSPATAQAFLMGHAMYWTVLIVLASLVAGLCVAKLAGARRRAVQVFGALGVSLVLVFQPITGVVAQLGQSNVHLVFVVVTASVLAALAGRTHPAAAISVVLAAAGLMMASWLPFAVVPIVMAVPLWRRIRVLGLDRNTVLKHVVPGATVFAWSLINYGMEEARAVVTAVTATTTEDSPSLVTATTHAHGSLWPSYTNPYSVPLVVTLLVVGTLCALLTVRTSRWTSAVAVGALVALGLGLVPTLVLVGGSADPLGYFPAKQLFITAMCLLPVTVGAALGATALGTKRAAIGIVGLVAVAIVALFAPTRSGLDKLTPTPLVIANGSFFGPDHKTADIVISNADSDELRLTWRFDATHDATVALMTSSFAPDSDAILLQPTRYVFRTYRNDFRADVACELAAADPRPLVLITRDPALEAELAAACPEAAIAVRLDPIPE